MNHVYITVGKRRWCVCCDLFQQGRFIDKSDCPNDALMADRNRIVFAETKRENVPQETFVPENHGARQ